MGQYNSPLVRWDWHSLPLIYFPKQSVWRQHNSTQDDSFSSLESKLLPLITDITFLGAGYCPTHQKLHGDTGCLAPLLPWVTLEKYPAAMIVLSKTKAVIFPRTRLWQRKDWAQWRYSRSRQAYGQILVLQHKSSVTTPESQFSMF